MKKLNKKSNKRRKKEKRFSWRLFFGFIMFMVFFTGITAPFVLLYGPFEEAKRTYVGAAMSTMSHQWLATTFLSDEKIDEILGNNQSQNVIANQDTSFIDIPKVKDDSIEQGTLVDNPKFVGHVLIINDPTRVKVGVSSKLGKEGETTSQIAINNNAIAAINGGAFTDEAGAQQWTSNGGIPTGILIAEGEVKHDDTDGERTNVAAITKEGILLVGNYSMDELVGAEVKDALSFNPPGISPVLITNGKMTNIYGDGGLGTAPRTLIGQRKNGAIVLVVLDSKIPGGRVSATLKEAQEVMYQLECVTATLLDGGKSTTMYYDGEVINNPSNSIGERPIASGFIVK